jgi:hypothetical protein
MKKKLITTIIALIFVSGFSFVAIAGKGGGNPTDTCALLAEYLTYYKVTGEKVSGNFIAWEIETESGPRVQVRVMLEKNNEWHSFGFLLMPFEGGFCNPDLTDDALLAAMKDVPCSLDIQMDFDGCQNCLPYLSDVKIKGRECIVTPVDAYYDGAPTIFGELILRLIPYKPPPTK